MKQLHPDDPEWSPAYLQLATGHVFPGHSIGAELSVAGEAVFQTGMVGYPEALTDPSYAGQLLILTYPIIGNYGSPDPLAVDDAQIPCFVESTRIHPAALVVADYTHTPSHWNSSRPLHQWLCSEGIPAIAGVDTRHLTKIIRSTGTVLARLIVKPDLSRSPPQFFDPNLKNLVAQVSSRDIRHISGNGQALAPRILIIDCGIKNNQIRELRRRSESLTIVPWDAPLESLDVPELCDAIFISNGPGDPAMVQFTVDQLRSAMLRRSSRPIFGICLGHQLLARAASFQTYKLKYGNRGHNQPCIDLTTGRCHITSQNHGFAVDASPQACPKDWFETFVNANDSTNEGIAHTQFPFFSVQFHPEACAGPHDTGFLFDVFTKAGSICRTGASQSPIFDAGVARRRARHRHEKVPSVILEEPIRKVIVLGSGGLSIGQAGEFDYSGSQAIKALKSRSVRTVLINPNIATVQTSPGLADKVYYLPVTLENVLKVAENDRPDAILMTFGGQTALNCGVELYKGNHLQRLGIRVLGTPVETILDTEDRERFNSRLAEIGEPYADSHACQTIEECVVAANDVGYPVIIRAAFALGGLGSGFADNEDQLKTLASRAFTGSSQVLVERSMKGWKEIEYEVVRDAYDNCVTVCNMENFDPLGVHTGDSIVVAPSQTLSDTEYHMLRNAAIRTVRHLGVVGECNIQYALHPTSLKYCVIEVNARLSRSSALASKATGYPLAFVAAQLALGISLPDIQNSITKETCACFEPSLDYIVVKIPRWDLRKFTRVSRRLGSSMKSVGEVMAIGRTFEEAMQKAVRMAHDNYVFGFESGIVEYSEDILINPTDERLLSIADGLAKGISVDKIHDLTKIDRWFLHKLAKISRCEMVLRKEPDIQDGELIRAKELGFSDRQIAKLIGNTELNVRKQRVSRNIRPCVKQIDTVAAEFPAKTNYLYVTYSCSSTYAAGRKLLDAFEDDINDKATSTSPSRHQGFPKRLSDSVSTDDDVTFNEHGIIVLGCGAYRIGSSVEFDCCAVSTTRTLRSQGTRSIMINYNPETVSTDYDECDRLYFEELSFERVLDVYNLERSSGIVVSMGGQIANNIAMALHRQSVRILGTAPEMIDSAENRYKFSRMCDKIGVDQPLWKELSSIGDAMAFCEDVGYPVLVRPSYVLSGAAMNVAHKAEDLEAYLTEAATVSPDCPVVISKFILEAKEIEVDAVAKKGDLVMHVISEHVENAGVHSGDATLILPPQGLVEATVRKVEEATAKVAQALNVTGPMNIQFIAKDNEIKVIECNLRASRSFPFVSKTIGLDLAKMATKVMLGRPVLSYPVDIGKIPFVGVKVAQFSFTRLLGADPILGVEMASTGEVACYGATLEEAYMKGLIATSRPPPVRSVCISIGSYKEKLEFFSSAKQMQMAGLKLFATPGTADFFQEHGVSTEVALWPTENEFTKAEGNNSIEKMLRDGRIEYLINIPSNNKYRRLKSFESPGYRVRRAAVDFNVPILTNIKCAKLFARVVQLIHINGRSLPLGLYDSRYSSKVISLPGFILLDTVLSGISADTTNDTSQKNIISLATSTALTGGFCHVALSVGQDVCHNVESFKEILRTCTAVARCEYSLYATARPGNAALVRPLSSFAAGLKMYPSKKDMKENPGVEKWRQHLRSWPVGTPVMIQASGASLAALLFAAVVSLKEVHVTQVRSKEDIELILASKDQELNITCDVNVLDLFATEASSRIERRDQEALWENLEVIDTITGPPALILPLLLQAVHTGRISLEWVRTRLHTNPARILGIEQFVSNRSSIEVDLDEKWEGPAASDVSGVACRGQVRRVVCDEKVLFLDGKIWAKEGDAVSLTADVNNALKKSGSRMSDSIDQIALERGASSKSPLLTREPDETEQSVGSLMQPNRRSNPFTSHPKDVVTPTWGRVGGIPSRSPLMSPVPKDVMGPDIAEKSSALANGKPVMTKPDWAMNGDVSLQSSSLQAADVLPGYGNGWWAGRHILSVSQFSRDDLHKLFEVAQEMRTMVSRVGHYELLRGKVMASLFYEPSTRTSCSFQAAMQRLGGTVLNIQDISSSSIAKGETLSDTIQSLCCYSDLIVIRHPEKGSAQEAASISRVPVINAGDGIGEHPTQAILDVYTIREELGTVNGLTITFVGDLKHGRTVHSLTRLLGMYSVRINYVSPDGLQMIPEVLEELASCGIEQHEYTDLTEKVVRETDVLYVTRVQKERFKSAEEYERVKGAYQIESRTLTRAKDNMIVMHPLPRVGEISQDVDSDPRAVYFRQMEHGMYARMALLAMVLGKN